MAWLIDRHQSGRALHLPAASRSERVSLAADGGRESLEGRSSESGEGFLLPADELVSDPKGRGNSPPDTRVAMEAVESSANAGHRDVLVVGVGGAGVNAVSRLQDVGLEGVRFVAVDTSRQTLRRAAGAQTVQLTMTEGQGAGGNPVIGAAAARAEIKGLQDAIGHADLVFVVCGLSGGTGGGAGPEVARIAAAAGGVVVGFGFTPFAFEAPRRAALAQEARELLARFCAATVILDNERALAVAGSAVPADVALRVADDVLRQAVQGLTELVTRSGPIDADLATVREILARGGECCLALGVGRGLAAATKAMQAALTSPLADMAELERAPAVLVQVTGGPDLTVRDTAEAVEQLRLRLDEKAFLVVGTGCDDALESACQVTILGTGLKRPPRSQPGFAAEKYDWRRRAEMVSPSSRRVAPAIPTGDER